MSKAYHAFWLLCLGLTSCGSGEAVTQDFGEGYQGGHEPPPATQRGESTPTPNLSDCPGCYNECAACLDTAGEDDEDLLLCLMGPACTTYFASFVDSIPEYGVSHDNVLGTPSPQEGPQDEQCSQIEDPCLLCECYFGPGSTECDVLC